MCSALASQKLQARKAPSLPGSPSGLVPGMVPEPASWYRRTRPPVISSRWIASTVEMTRGSAAGRKPTSGMSSTAASSWSAP